MHTVTSGKIVYLRMPNKSLQLHWENCEGTTQVTCGGRSKRDCQEDNP